jgi:hypothetical protein
MLADLIIAVWHETCTGAIFLSYAAQRWRRFTFIHTKIRMRHKDGEYLHSFKTNISGWRLQLRGKVSAGLGSVWEGLSVYVSEHHIRVPSKSSRLFRLYALICMYL